MTPSLTLYTYWRSSSAYRVRIVLGAKGLAYEPVYVDLLAGEQALDPHLARSPMGYVPALVVDGDTFVESVAIVEMLEEIAPAPPLLPSDRRGRARVREIVQLIASGIQPLQNVSVQKRVSDDPVVRAEWTRHFIAKGLGAVERLMERNEREGMVGPFACGDGFTMADAFVVPQVYAAQRFGVDLAATPRIARANEAARELPFVAAARPEAQGDAKA